MTSYLSTGAYFDIRTGRDGREVPYEHVVDVTIWVHNVFDYINLFENGVDLRKLYEEDKLYEENYHRDRRKDRIVLRSNEGAVEDYIEQQFIVSRKEFKTIDRFIEYAKSARDGLAAGIIPKRIY